MNSAIYEGTLHHRRMLPTPHDFSVPIAMPLLDLDELHDVFDRHPLWSIERPNGVSFRRGDYGGDDVALDDAVRVHVMAHTGRWPAGRVSMLAHVRTWGWLFNPLSVYFCTDPASGAVDALVLEVTNTPWHERHTYVVDGGAGEHRFAKALHVSPFMSMDQEYRLRVTDPDDQLLVRLSSFEQGEPVFDASLTLRRRPMTRESMGRLLWRHPFMTHRVSAGIYGQALRLRAKGIPVHRHLGADAEPSRAGAGAGR